MPTVELDDTQLEYVEQGNGEPVVLVHGTLGDFRSWELQMDDFARRHRVISYSRRYHHPNECEGSETDYSAVLHADDLAELIGALGLDSAHVVGNSYGAYTALFLAMRHPGRVRSLVAGEPPVFPILDEHPEGRALRDGFLRDVWGPTRERLQEGETEQGVRTFVDGVVEPGAFDGFPEEVRTLIKDNACELKAETSSPDFWTSFDCHDAERVSTPTLLLTGAQSLRMFRLVVEELDRCLPDSELVVLEQCSHEMPADDPEAYNEAVLGFLEDRSG